MKVYIVSTKGKSSTIGAKEKSSTISAKEQSSTVGAKGESSTSSRAAPEKFCAVGARSIKGIVELKRKK